MENHQKLQASKQSHQQQSQNSQNPRFQQQSSTVNSPKVDHQFFTKMADINSIENDLIKLLNDFSNTRLKKYGKFLRAIYF